MKTLSYNFNISEFRLEKSVSVGNNNFNAYFIHDYYPTRFQEVDDNIKRVRRLVYDFKEGRNSTTVGTKIANAISRKNLHLNNSCICVIPASTRHKTQNRYSEFCKVVSGATGIQNGFSYITNRVDRDEMKGQFGGDKISTFDFHSHLYRGKTVLLFDDVYTSGTSFKQMAEKLMTTGAAIVIGIFLAKTYSDYVHYLSHEEAGFYDPIYEPDSNIPEVNEPEFENTYGKDERYPDYSENVKDDISESEEDDVKIKKHIYNAFHPFWSWTYPSGIKEYKSGIWKIIILAKNKLIVYKDYDIVHDTIYKRSLLSINDLNSDTSFYELNESGMLSIISNPITCGKFLLTNFHEGHPFCTQYFINGANSFRVTNNLLVITGIISTKSNFFERKLDGQIVNKNAEEYFKGMGYGVTFFDIRSQEVIRSFRYESSWDGVVTLVESGHNYVFVCFENTTQIIFTDNYSILNISGCNYSFFGNYVLFLPSRSWSDYDDDIIVFAVADLSTKSCIDVQNSLKSKYTQFAEDVWRALWYFYDRDVSFKIENEVLIIKNENQVIEIPIKDLFEGSRIEKPI